MIAVHWRNYLSEGCGDYVIAGCLHISPTVPDAVNLSLDIRGLVGTPRDVPKGSPSGEGIHLTSATLGRSLLNDALKSLAIPENDATMNAGEILENLGFIWEKATLEEKHKLLRTMLEAVYVDLAASRSVVGIQPKAPFYPLFDSLKQIPGNKVMIFRPGEVEQRKTGSSFEPEPDCGLVETGESRTPRPKELAQDLLQA